jgi:hypothetical protein
MQVSGLDLLTLFVKVCLHLYDCLNMVRTSIDIILIKVDKS